MPTEVEWVKTVVDRLAAVLAAKDPALSVTAGTKLRYANEVRKYDGAGDPEIVDSAYETDMLITETVGDSWKPRVVIEAKVVSVTTHDAITYSQKAALHKQVHPYLRYGIMLGNRGKSPLPGRLYRNGAYFDFMLSWVDFEPTDDESRLLVALALDEVKASRRLEEIIYANRGLKRTHYTLLQRRLILGSESFPGAQ